MRYGPDHKFWVVVDATRHSTLEDIVFKASLRDLELQFKGGLKIEENPTLFTDRRDAESEANGRLMAKRAAEAIARSDAKFQDVTRIELLDGDGKVLFETDLPGEGK
ncbi:MAG: hypothetical protein KAY32_16385 [Candidatus Eisenbacteria sp.]|nr:hypothetical protein [Candidatus Eisenbacteria bacterium]